MKIKAAHDWLQMEQGLLTHKKNAERHVFDVYMLVAMLTEAELEEAATLAASYQNHPIAVELRTCAIQLYGEEEAPGMAELRQRLRESVNYSLFWTALKQAIGI